MCVHACTCAYIECCIYGALQHKLCQLHTLFFVVPCLCQPCQIWDDARIRISCYQAMAGPRMAKAVAVRALDGMSRSLFIPHSINTIAIVLVIIIITTSINIMTRTTTIASIVITITIVVVVVVIINSVCIIIIIIVVVPGLALSHVFPLVSLSEAD